MAIFTRMYPQFPGRGASCIRPALVPQGRPQGSPLRKGHRQLQTALVRRRSKKRMSTKPFSYGVIFDLEGVLIDSEGLYYRAYSAVLKAYGGAVSHAEYE